MGKSASRHRCYFGGDYTPDLDEVLNTFDKDVEVISEYPSMFDMIDK